MTKVMAMGNALVDMMTVIDNYELLESLRLPKGSMQLVDRELSTQIRERLRGYHTTMSSGGSAANTIRSLANLGVPTQFIGKIGNDDTGDFFAADMKRTGVQPQLIRSETPSGMAVAFVTPDSERTFATYLGAAAEMLASDINNDNFNSSDILHLEGYLIINNELIEKAASLAKKNGMLVSLDLASYNVVQDNLQFLKYLIEKYVDIVFANEEEAKAFTGQEPEEAVKTLSTLCNIAVVKTGRTGSLVENDSNLYRIPPEPATRTDTTGAGDYYAAGFLYGIANKMNIQTCGKIGTILAANVIEVYGATLDEQRWNKIRTQIKQL